MCRNSDYRDTDPAEIWGTDNTELVHRLWVCVAAIVTGLPIYFSSSDLESTLRHLHVPCKLRWIAFCIYQVIKWDTRAFSKIDEEGWGPETRDIREECSGLFALTACPSYCS